MKTNRLLTDSGYYHIVLKGIGNMVIFENSKDNDAFLKIMKSVKEEIGFELNAYCLMSNHVHLLIGDKNNQLPKIIQKIALKYAKYFNYKYERKGHLFQGRYRSGIITSDRQFMLTFRYILQNPIKAGLVNDCNYRWNSFSDYCGSGRKDKLIDTEMALQLFGGLKELIKFVECEETEKYTDFENDKKITDEEALRLVQNAFGKGYNTTIMCMQKAARNSALRQLKAMGLTIKQIERITGIGRNIVQRA